MSRGATLRVDLGRFLPSFVLAGYGIFILSLFTRHLMTWYINPAYVGVTTFAGALLFGLAVVKITRLPNGACSTPEEGSCCSSDSCGCPDSSPRLWAYAVLSVPLLLALLFPPRSLASFSAKQRGPQIAGLTPIHGAAIVHRVSLSVNTASFSLQDWVGALSADPNPKDYLGKPIVLTGMVIHNVGSEPNGYLMVIRYQVTCCIADARPEGLIVRDTSNGALKDNQWVTVKGKMTSTNYAGQSVPVVNPKEMTPTKAGNPYMY